MLGASCAFPSTRNVGVPLMATLNLHGFTLRIPIWLFSTLTVLNSPDTSQANTLYQGHQNNVSPSPVATSPPPSTSCSESSDTSNLQSKRSKRRKNMKKTRKQGAEYFLRILILYLSIAF